MKWKATDGSCRLIIPIQHIATDKATLSIFGNPVLCKGAISAKAGERVVIPLNMKDGI